MATQHASSLSEYARKRRFKVTAEPPPGRTLRTARSLRFVVQKHAASRLHFDFRLELDGTLKSWAVPKGPSLNPSDKRLAVQVEDHPIEYATFEGKIPAGEYGGGEVIVWDEGTWVSHDPDPAAALKKGKVRFTLKGGRLKGDWHLFRLGGQSDAGKPNWFLVKVKDAFASEDGDRLVREEMTSIKSGRTLEEIAGGRPGGASGKAANRKRADNKVNGRTRGSTTPSAASAAFSAAAGARRAAMREYQPQLCTLVDEVPEGSGWIHELKFDGYRLLAHRDGEDVRLLSRRGLDWANRFKTIVEAIRAFPVSNCVIDGEACALDANGRPSFQLLQGVVKKNTAAPMVYFAFDLLYADGYDLSDVPLIERKRLLREILAAAPSTPTIDFSEHFLSDGRAMHQQVCEMALEGVISKRADGPHTPTRSRDWLKIKCGHRQEFVVIGWTDPSGTRRHFGSLLLGAYRGGSLVYTGRAGTGFADTTLAATGKRLRALKTDTSDAASTMTPAERRGAHWVRPELVAEVSFAEWTTDARLRQPVFQGFRDDKDPKEVVIENPAHNTTRPKRTARTDKRETTAASPAPVKRSSRSKAKPQAALVAGVAISNGDRVLFADAGVTKLQVAQYYDSVAPVAMPYLSDRPLSTLRCPEGTSKQCFFQKHLAPGFGEDVHPVRINKGEKDYFFIDTVPGLIALAQFGVIEFHPWASHVESLEKPEFIVFDLDPGEDVSFKQVVAAALHLRDALAEIKLKSFAKVTGGKGVHVVVPLTPEAGWDAIKDFAHAVARYLAQSEPKRFLSVMTKAKRTGRIFVDYLRNGRGATAIAPYSVRARPGAPVAMPVSWEELERVKSADQFTVLNSLAYLAKRKSDPWASFLTIRQSLPAFPSEPSSARGRVAPRTTSKKGRSTRAPVPIRQSSARSKSR